ncbi:MAG: hypothetical protein AAFP08_13250, partial [Bacteroidota bacterium]
MKSTEQAGFLDEQLGDQKIPLPDELNWQAMGDQIVPPDEKSRRRFLPLWLFWVAGVGLIAPILYFSFTPTTKPGLVDAAKSIEEPHLMGVEEILSTHATQDEQNDNFPSRLPENDSEDGTLNASSTNNPASDVEQVEDHTRSTPKTLEVVTKSEIPLSEVDSMYTSSAARVEGLDPQPILVHRLMPVVNIPSSISPLRTQEADQSLHYLQLKAGTAAYLGLPDRFDRLYDPQIGIDGQFTIRNRWLLRIGLQWGRQSWRSDLLNTEDAFLYRPGTPDTLYRNLATGEERLVTTDSVNGFFETRFTGYSQLDLISLPLSVGRSWSFLSGDFSLAIGLSPTWVVSQKGRTVDAESNIVSIQDADFGDGFLLPVTLGLQQIQQLTPSLHLLFSTQFEWSSEQPWSSLGYNEDWRRWQFNVGLRYR